MILDDPILDDLDDELDLTNTPINRNECRTFKHKNGYTMVSICNCKHGSLGHAR